MNVSIKNALLFAFGGTVGGFVGYLVGDLIVYKLQEETVKEMEDETLKDEMAVVVPNIGVNYTDYSKQLEKLASRYKGVEEREMPAIQIVKYDDLAKYDSKYVMEEIAYYEVDGVFSTENEEPIANFNELFGEDISKNFGAGSEDPDIVYVLNENTIVIYEITRVHGSYASLVLGMPLEKENKKPAARRVPKRKKSAEYDEDSES